MESIHQVHDYGDFLIGYGHMQTDPNDRTEEPVMWLRRKRSGINGRPAFVVPLSAAHLYTDDNYIVNTSRLAATVTGFYADRWIVFRIASAISECLPELVRMPPAPLPDTKRLVEQAIEQQGLSLKIDGREMLL